MAQSGPLRLEALRDANGREAGVQPEPNGAGGAQWKRKAVRFALGAAILPTVLAGAFGAGIYGSLALSDQPMSDGSKMAKSIIHDWLAPLTWLRPLEVEMGQKRSQSVIDQAQAEWNWAKKEGYYRSAAKPAIGNFDPDAAFDADAGAPKSDNTANFSQNLKQFNLSGSIQIARSVVNPEYMTMSEDVSKEIKYTILHESYHSDTFTHPQTDVFGGALAQGSAGDMWRAAFWANDVARRAPIALARGHGAEMKELKERIGSLRNAYDETGADSFAMIALAHQLPKAEWNEHLIHLEGSRAETLLMSGAVGRDGHETQEGLQIVAALGHDKLAALTPQQSMTLAEAIASDSVMLAARKQGLEHDVYFAARNAEKVLNWGEGEKKAAYLPFFKMVEEKIMPGMMPAAVAWSKKSEQERLDANVHWLQESAQWNTGAHLDYGFIQPGLVANLAPHAPHANYETRSGSGTGLDIENQQPKNWKKHPDQANSLQGLRALQEWRDVAKSLGERDALEIEKTKQFHSIASLLDQPTKEALSKDAFWTPTLSSMAQRVAQRRAEDAAGKSAPQTAGAQYVGGPKL